MDNQETGPLSPLSPDGTELLKVSTEKQLEKRDKEISYGPDDQAGHQDDHGNNSIPSPTTQNNTLGVESPGSPDGLGLLNVKVEKQLEQRDQEISSFSDTDKVDIERPEAVERPIMIQNEELFGDGGMDTNLFGGLPSDDEEDDELSIMSELKVDFEDVATAIGSASNNDNNTRNDIETTKLDQTEDEDEPGSAKLVLSPTQDRPEAVERPIMIQSSMIFPSKSDLNGAYIFGGLPDDVASEEGEKYESKTYSDDDDDGQGSFFSPDSSIDDVLVEEKMKKDLKMTNNKKKKKKMMMMTTTAAKSSKALSPKTIKKASPKPKKKASPRKVEEDPLSTSPSPRVNKESPKKVNTIEKEMRPDAVERPILVGSNVFPGPEAMGPGFVVFGGIPDYNDTSSAESSEMVAVTRKKQSPKPARQSPRTQISTFGNKKKHRKSQQQQQQQQGDKSRLPRLGGDPMISPKAKGKASNLFEMDKYIVHKPRVKPFR